MKELSVLPKECWLPDGSGNACYNCEKSFNILRRKHHCRYCGYLFCSKCVVSKYQIPDGTLLKKICKKCLDSIIKSKQKPETKTVSYPIIPNRSSSAKLSPLIEDENNDESEDEQEDDEQEIEPGVCLPEEDNAEQRAFEVFEELKSDQFSQYNNDAENFLEIRVKTFLAENHLSSLWVDGLMNGTKQVVKNICPSVHYRKDEMDINNYLRIIKVINEERSFKYIKGVVFEKNLAIKKMTKKITSPKILMLQGNSGFYSEEKKLVSIQQLDEQERHYSEVLIKKFNHIKPDLVIVEKGMPQFLISSLSQHNISIFINVKLKVLSLIARISNGEVLEHINHTS